MCGCMLELPTIESESTGFVCHKHGSVNDYHPWDELHWSI